MTPATVRAVEAADLGPPIHATVDGTGLAWRRFEGALWYEVGGSPPECGGGTRWKRLGVSEFTAFLDGTLGWADVALSDLGMALVRTPLAAAVRGGSTPERGEPPEVRDGPNAPRLPIAEILSDGREEAVRMLQAFMAERILFAGDSVLVRGYDPLVVPAPDGPRLQPFPQCRPVRNVTRIPLGYRADAYQAAMIWEGRVGRIRRRQGSASWIADLAGAPYGDGTAILVSGLAVTAACDAFEEVWGPRGRFRRDLADHSRAEDVRVIAEEARMLEVRAGLGWVDGPGAVRAVDVAAALLDAIRNCHGTGLQPSGRVQAAERLVRRFREFEWPLACVATMTDEDAEALAQLD